MTMGEKIPDSAAGSAELIEQFVYSECGKQCKNVQGLAGHRSRVHGIRGANYAKMHRRMPGRRPRALLPIEAAGSDRTVQASGPLKHLATQIIIAQDILALAEGSNAAAKLIADALKPLRLRYIKLKAERDGICHHAQEIAQTIAEDGGDE